MPVFGVFLNIKVLFDTADVTAVCNVICVVFADETLIKLKPPSKDILSLMPILVVQLVM